MYQMPLTFLFRKANFILCDSHLNLKKKMAVRVLGGQPSVASLLSCLRPLRLRSQAWDSVRCDFIEGSLLSLLPDHWLPFCRSNIPNPSLPQDLCSAVSSAWLFFPQIFPRLASAPRSGLSSSVTSSGRPPLTL